MKCSRKRCIDCKNFIGIGETFCFCKCTVTPLPTKYKKVLYQYNWCEDFERKVAVSDKKGGKSAK